MSSLLSDGARLCWWRPVPAYARVPLARTAPHNGPSRSWWQPAVDRRTVGEGSSEIEKSCNCEREIRTVEATITTKYFKKGLT